MDRVLKVNKNVHKYDTQEKVYGEIVYTNHSNCGNNILLYNVGI